MKSPDEIKCHFFQLEKITYIPTLPGFCFPFGLLHRFGGLSFEVFGVAFRRRSQGWTELFRKSCTAKPFSRRSLNLLLDFSSNAKKHSPFVPFPVGLKKKSSSFRSATMCNTAPRTLGSHVSLVTRMYKNHLYLIVSSNLEFGTPVV